MSKTQAALIQHFRLTLDDRELSAMFRECTGLDSESEITEYRSLEDSGQPVVRKVPGATKWSNITLKRGLGENRELWDWRGVVHREGAHAARTDGTIELIDSEGSPIATYRFIQGWPVKYSAAEPLAASGDVAGERIVIAHEGFVRA
jgi:phage tail-like protein